MKREPNTSALWLRAMEPEDVDAIYEWENDPSVWNDSAAHQPFSRHELARFIEECRGADIYSCRQLRLMADIGREAVGCVDIFDFEPHHRRAGVGIIVAKRHRRKGLGLSMLTQLEDFARRHLCLHQLHCTIAADNEASLALFGKAGYRRCGTLSEWLLDNGRWSDALTFQKIIE